MQINFQFLSANEAVAVPAYDHSVCVQENALEMWRVHRRSHLEQPENQSVNLEPSWWFSLTAEQRLVNGGHN